MQTVEKMEAFGFVILCGGENYKTDLKFCLERINKLSRKNTNIQEIFVYLVPVKNGIYIKGPKYKEYLESLENIKVTVVNGRTENATEPRAYNYGLEHVINSHVDYVTFLHETDIIMDRKILDYYMWLFNTAHNPDLIGAVNLKTNVAVKQDPSKLSKMWYADDMYLRGACIKKQALKDAGPFDESLIYRVFEWDLFCRMAHHAGWLTRVGKEENEFIKFGGPDLTGDHMKISILDKQSKVLFAKKWHFKGVWPEAKDSVGQKNCYIRKNTLYNDERSGADFFNLFKLSDAERKDLKARFKQIYSDTAIKSSIKMSKSFLKKPIGNFMPTAVYLDGVQIKNNMDIQTHVSCELEYYDDLFWNAKGVY